MEPDTVYTIQEVAEFLKMSYGYVYGEVRGGGIPSTRFGNQYRIKGSDVLTLLEERS